MIRIILLSVSIFWTSVTVSADSLDFGESRSQDFQQDEILLTYAGSTLWSGIGDFIIDENLIYAVMANGLVILDITNPISPVFISQTYLSGFNCLSICLSDNYIFVGLVDSGFQILDVSNPAEPIKVGEYSKHCTARGIAAEDNYVYVSCGIQLEIVNVNDIVNPVLEGTFPFPYSQGYVPGRIEVINDTAYIAAGDIWVIDIANPKDPVEIARFDSPKWALDIDVVDSFIYVADQSIILPAGYSAFSVIDKRRLDSLIVKSSVDVPGRVTRLSIQNGYAYISAGLSGLGIFDIDDPENPILEGCYSSPNRAGPIFARDNNIYLVDYFEALFEEDPIPICDTSDSGENTDFLLDIIADPGDFQVIDASDKSNPVLAGVYPLSGYKTAVKVAGDYAYVGHGECGGVSIVDISDPDTLMPLSFVDTPDSPEDLAISGDYLYVADRLSGLQIVNISNPDSPYVAQTFETPGVTMGIEIVGSFAYVADGDNGFFVLDIADPLDPVLKGYYDTPDFALRVVIKDCYAFIADRYSGLQILNISNPAQPAYVTTYTYMGQPALYNGLAIQDNFVYLSNGSGSFEIVNVVDPFNPSLAGLYIDARESYDIMVSGDYVFLANVLDGVYMVNVSDPANPYLSAKYNTPLFANGIDVSGQYIYVADYASLIRLQISEPTDIRNDDGNINRMSQSFVLMQNYPNPFNSTTSISFEIPYKVHVSLSIYNIVGQKIKTIIKDDRSAGIHIETWDGTDDNGHTVASGIYLFRLESEEFSESRKMLYLK